MTVTSDAPSVASHTLAAYLKTPVWARESGSGPDSDVVLASRARLARNLADFPFPCQASDLDLRRVAQHVRRAAHADTSRLADLVHVSLAHLSNRDRADLVDARRISPDMAQGSGANRYALLDETGHLSVFVNEEDHVRIQTVAAGNATLAVLRSAENADMRFARKLSYAHDPLRWGYLTTSLGNVGTGLRLSVLVHLPALAFLNKLDVSLCAAHDLGISVRAAHGEHSVAAGDLYQVSNAVTWGVTNDAVAGRVRPVADYLIAQERGARREVEYAHGRRAQKMAQLAWERIEEAEYLNAADALRLLSVVRLAAASGVWGGPDAGLFAALVADLRTGDGLLADHDAAPNLRNAIGRAARLRNALRPVQPG